MSYQLEISATAEQAAESAFLHISQTASVGKAKYWYAGLLEAIESLKALPQRTKAMASRSQKMKCRQLNYGSGSHPYQILYAIIDDPDLPTICILDVQANRADHPWG